VIIHKGEGSKFYFEIIISYLSILNPNYAIKIIKLAYIIASRAFTENHRLTFGLNCPDQREEMPLWCKFSVNTLNTSINAIFITLLYSLG